MLFQTVMPYHNMSPKILNRMLLVQGLWWSFRQSVSCANITVTAQKTRQATLVAPESPDTSATWGNLGITWPRQRQRVLSTRDVMNSLRANSGNSDKKATTFSNVARYPIVAQKRPLTPTTNSTEQCIWRIFDTRANQPCELKLFESCCWQSKTSALGNLNNTF